MEPSAAPSGLLPPPEPGGRVSGMQHVDKALDRMRLRGIRHVLAALFGHRANRGFHQIAHHGFDVAPDVADLGVFRRFDFDERRADQPRQTPRDLGLADAGRADHENVFRRDLVAQVFPRARSPVAVAQRDGHRTFGFRWPTMYLSSSATIWRGVRVRGIEPWLPLPSRQSLYGDIGVRVDADLRGDLERFARDFLGAQAGCCATAPSRPLARTGRRCRSPRCLHRVR